MEISKTMHCSTFLTLTDKENSTVVHLTLFRLGGRGEGGAFDARTDFE